MPNIKSAEKRVKIIKSKTMRNSAQKAALRTQVRKCKEAIGNRNDMSDILKDTSKALDKAAAKGLIHKNTAARKKSRLVKAAATQAS
ncbi:MAG TPA: 30S ribosomal protein S20 [Clostridiales bacterium]|nr:30S ribosomal protein S20 [Clostridiales bacterium]